MIAVLLIINLVLVAVLFYKQRILKQRTVVLSLFIAGVMRKIAGDSPDEPGGRVPSIGMMDTFKYIDSEFDRGHTQKSYRNWLASGAHLFSDHKMPVGEGFSGIYLDFFSMAVGEYKKNHPK